jgi:hypothetical protein
VLHRNTKFPQENKEETHAFQNNFLSNNCDRFESSNIRTAENGVHLTLFHHLLCLHSCFPTLKTEQKQQASALTTLSSKTVVQAIHKLQQSVLTFSSGGRAEI